MQPAGPSSGNPPAYGFSPLRIAYRDLWFERVHRAYILQMMEDLTMPPCRNEPQPEPRPEPEPEPAPTP